MNGYLHKLRSYARRLWIRTALIMGLALVGLASAPVLAKFLPGTWLYTTDAEEVRTLLDILANSMLAVTTFSVATMVSAHLAADQAASPRAHRILREDGRTQTSLATFVGAFVYALLSIILIQLELLSDEALAVAYGMTILVLVLVIVTILRWIQHLAALGSVEATTRTAEEGALNALRRRERTPFLGGARFAETIGPPDGVHSVTANEAGYLTFLNVPQLSQIAGENGASVWIAVSPGDWIGPGDTLLHTDCDTMDDDLEGRLRAQCRMAEMRTLEQDAAFGVTVLAEIAERALSPGINDPRTAIDVSSRLLTMLISWSGEREAEPPDYPNVHIAPLDTFELVQTAFEPIARDGKTFVEVQVAVQRALARLSRHRDAGVADAARLISHRALAYAELGLSLDADRARVAAVAPADSAAPARVQPPEMQVGKRMVQDAAG